MNDDTTNKLPNQKSFEERVFERFDAQDSFLSLIDRRLIALEEKDERRSYDTRPIWEQVLVKLESIEVRLSALEEGQAGLRDEMAGVKAEIAGLRERLTSLESEMRERMSAVEHRLERVENEVYALNKKFRVFNADILKLQDFQEDLDERVQKLEPAITQ